MNINVKELLGSQEDKKKNEDTSVVHAITAKSNSARKAVLTPGERELFEMMFRPNSDLGRASRGVEGV